jgi:HAD superfamily hydrolase (TIGR01549 family)
MPYSLYLWDYDNTMVDSHPAIMHCLMKVVTRNLPELKTNDRIAETLKHGVYSGLKLELIIEQALSGLASTSLQDQIVHEYRELYLKEGVSQETFLPGAKEVIQAIHSRGKTQVVVSNKKGSSVRSSLIHHQIDGYFAKVYGSDDQSTVKPDPNLYHDHICNDGFAHPNEKILMIGDSTTDGVFAKNLGVDFCCIATNKESNLGVPIKYLASNFFELMDLLTTTSQ